MQKCFREGPPSLSLARKGENAISWDSEVVRRARPYTSNERAFSPRCPAVRATQHETAVYVCVRVCEVQSAVVLLAVVSEGKEER